MSAQLCVFVVLCLYLSASWAEKECTGTATYMIDFMGTWSTENHPNFPAGAKFTPLAGCSHNDNYTMWDADMEASKGVQAVAEKGNASTLNYEIMMQKNQGNAYMYTEAKEFDAPGMAKSHIRVSYKFPLVSLISMIFPSPDWFVGIKKMKLCDADGQWKDTAEMELQPWDAGTADGTTFVSSMTPTDPQGKIEIITNADETPLKGAQAIKPLGKITLKRVCDGQQTYTLKFIGKWSQQDHPTDFPSGAHFSPLVGASHSTSYHFWRADEPASPGVKLVAERGTTGTLKNELNAKKEMDPSYILQIFEGKNFISPGEDTVKVEVDGMHPMVSAISMLAPSPDWFVGIDSMNLCNNWSWRNMAEMKDLPPWDSGTDSGPRFQSPDDPTNPPVNIAIIPNSEEGSFKSDEATKTLGSFVFMRDGYDPSMSTMTTEGSGATMATTTESGVAGIHSFVGLLLAATFWAALTLM